MSKKTFTKLLATAVFATAILANSASADPASCSWWAMHCATAHGASLYVVPPYCLNAQTGGNIYCYIECPPFHAPDLCRYDF